MFVPISFVEYTRRRSRERVTRYRYRHRHRDSFQRMRANSDRSLIGKMLERLTEIVKSYGSVRREPTERKVTNAKVPFRSCPRVCCTLLRDAPGTRV